MTHGSVVRGSNWYPEDHGLDSRLKGWGVGGGGGGSFVFEVISAWDLRTLLHLFISVKSMLFILKLIIIIFLFNLDEFETLCGHRKKGFKIVETLTGPRVQGMYVSMEDTVFTKLVETLPYSTGNRQI